MGKSTVGLSRYTAWSGLADKVLRKHGEPMTTTELRNAMGIDRRQQASHLMFLSKAADDEDNPIVDLGYEDSRTPVRLWGLYEWGLTPRNTHLATRQAKRLNRMQQNRKNELQRQRREAARQHKEDRRDNGKARKPSQSSTDSLTLLLGEEYTCIGVELVSGGGIVMTLLAKDGSKGKVSLVEE